MLAPPRGVHLPQLLAQRAVPRGAAAAKGRRVSEQRLAGRVRAGSSKVPRGNGADGSGASISASVSSAGRRSASVRSAACGSPPAQNLPPRAVRLNGPREGLAWLIRARGVWMRRDESKSELLETHLRRRGAQAEQTDARDERRLRWPLSIVAGGGRRVGASPAAAARFSPPAQAVGGAGPRRRRATRRSDAARRVGAAGVSWLRRGLAAAAATCAVGARRGGVLSTRVIARSREARVERAVRAVPRRRHLERVERGTARKSRAGESAAAGNKKSHR